MVTLFQPMKSIGTRFATKLLFSLLLLLISDCSGHGLVEYPASRNQFCGVETKPEDRWKSSDAIMNPECLDIFDSNPRFNQEAYQFMSVLSNGGGRSTDSPLPTYVCGYNSNQFFGPTTPWDAYGPNVDWPVNDFLVSGSVQEFRWNIQWGSHFGDTKEFKHWVTKSDFVYDPTQPLTWNDFEVEPFCDLQYFDDDNSANPSVIPLYDQAKFETYCVLPERTGRHVIYVEWGRRPPSSDERFHGCIDAVFTSSGNTPAPTSAPTPTTTSSSPTTTSPTSSPIAIPTPTYVPTPQPEEVPTATPIDPTSSSPPPATPTTPPPLPDGSNIPTLPPNNDYTLIDILDGDQVSQIQQQNEATTDILFGIYDCANDVTLVYGPSLSPTPLPTTALPSPSPSPVSSPSSPSSPTPPSSSCTVFIQPGANAWFVGLLVGFDGPTVTLVFESSSLQTLLSDPRVTVQQASSSDWTSVVVDSTSIPNTITLTNPGWVTNNTPGFLGIYGSEVVELPQLADVPPTCHTTTTIMT